MYARIVSFFDSAPSRPLRPLFFFHCFADPRDLHSFPTRRSSDLSKLDWKRFCGGAPEQPFTPEKFVWWRFFWDFGGGILTDLLTHWIDVIQWYMGQAAPKTASTRSEEHTSELQSRQYLVCRLLLE